MEKIIKLALNKYAPIPYSLQNRSSGTAAIDIPVGMAALFHHYYLDTRGHAPPDPDPAHFEHLSFFCVDSHLRLKGDGIGTSLAFRISRSNDLGQAFCRWFLYTHLNITYFAHMHTLLDKPVTTFSGHRIERIAKGDTPDYFCAETRTRVFLAEAKCRRESVSFKNAAFSSWRKQFERVVVKDGTGNLRSVKGHIVAVRLAAESDGARVQSKLFAEDPMSPGNIMLGEDSSLGDVIIMRHYAEITAKLSQPILAAALAGDFTVPEEIQFPAFVWEFRFGPLAGKRFVGGIYAKERQNPDFVEAEGGYVIRTHPLRLDLPGATYFGVEEGIFRTLTQVARAGHSAVADIRTLPDLPFIYSGVSVLRDGSVIGPADFFRAIGLVTY
ncbi:hypothetical protein FRZ44_33860 [Hypericibacter terrae]|uniref:Uncharacterized protein n=1 Tax=Hypericibacter terrae TaxID=2602015 RepID=A0A5J6MKG2_9PROT|nr:hypothetical protein [Hypericibacter terrae]QEX18082.1 hypothetical protein FRZ44_33860 [Hypericibacter terrae]